MKRYIGIAVALVAIVAGFVLVSQRANDRVKRAQQAEALAELRVGYLERVGWIRSNPSAKGYLEEVNPFLRSWFSAVDAHVQRFDLNAKFDDYLQRAEKRTGSGEKRKGADPKVHYEYVRRQFDALRSNRYLPNFTGTDQGLRLDVITEEVMAAGEPHVRYRVLLWGPQRELRDEGKGKRMATSAAFSVGFRFTDEKGKQIAEMNAADPSMKIDWPEGFIAEFPPQMAFGHYDVGLVPAEAKKAEITFGVTSRAATGGEAQAKFVWKLDVPGEWKLQPGQRWEGAEETTRSPDELGGP